MDVNFELEVVCFQDFEVASPSTRLVFESRKFDMAAASATVAVVVS